MTDTRIVPWYEVDRPVTGFATNTVGEVLVQRESIPIIFVPGVMGSRLRLAGTDGEGTGPDGLPNMRWDPNSNWYMFYHYSGASPIERRQMLIGDNFNPNFLEVHDANPVGDGLQGIFSDYHPALQRLCSHDWGALAKIFLFPVYAFGYNWTDSNLRSGARLAARIEEIVEEARSITGMCEKVILLSHSMGGLVCRAASELHGARDKILGIIHGVQPAMGSPTAYWRIKAGFEGFGMISRILGDTGPRVTVILGNSPGGLQLLPNHLYRTNDGQVAWLRVTQSGGMLIALPTSDPYNEIYRIPAVASPPAGRGASTNAYWGLIDPNLLDPGNVPATAAAPATGLDALSDRIVAASTPWDRYKMLLEEAEKFHRDLGQKKHPYTWSFHGTGQPTADSVELAVESNWFRSESYGTRDFRGFFRDASGRSMQAVLQDPAGDGDGTVPISSATSLNGGANASPGVQAFAVEHQPAYENDEVQRYAIRAVIALAQKHYRERRGERASE